MGTSQLELVVLDPAGTLLVDDEAVGTALAEALGVVGAPVDGVFRETSPSYVAHTRGISIFAVLRSLLGDDDQARYALRAFELAFPSVLAQGGVEVLPGAEAAITTLRQAGRRVCLMSRLPESCVDAIVGAVGWHDLVDLTVAPAVPAASPTGTARAHACGDQEGWTGSRTPPHPDMVLAAIMRLGVAGVRDVAVVADSANPLVAGTRAGASAVIGVIGGEHARVELERVPHTHVVHSVGEVPALLDVVSSRVDARPDAA